MLDKQPIAYLNSSVLPAGFSEIRSQGTLLPATHTASDKLVATVQRV